jgi:MYXO-CTERM domain-containing protein
MINRMRLAMMLVGGLLLIIPGLQAVVLPGTGGVAPPDVFGAGPLLLGPGTVPELSPVNSGTFSGTLLSDVFTDSVTGNLDFVYQYFAGVTPPQQGIEKITAASYNPAIADGAFADPFGTGTGVDEGYAVGASITANLIGVGFSGAGTFAPDLVTRSADGTIVGFNFDAGAAIPAGGISDILVVRTHATTFTMGQGGVIDSQTANVSVYAPSPEPRLAGLAAMALLGIVAFFFRRRKVQVTE